MKPTIGFITDSIRAQSTGIGYYAESFITAFTARFKGKMQYTFIDYEPTAFNQKKLLLIKNPFGLHKPYLWHLLLPYRLRNTSIDYIFNFNPAPHPTAYMQKEVLFIYDLSLDTHTHTHPLHRVFTHKLFFRSMLSHSFKIVTVSASTRHDLLHLYNVPTNKTSIYYYTPQISPSASQRPNFLPNKPYIFNLNTIEPRKNLETLITAFAEAKHTNRIPHILIISGKKGWGYKHIFKLRDRLNMQNDIVFSGYVSEKEKQYLFKHASLFIYPSTKEGFGIPVLEAMLARCPTITTNTAQLDFITRTTSILISPSDVKQLSRSIIALLRDSKKRNAMTKAAFKKAREFVARNSKVDTIDSLVRFLEIYDEES